MGGVFGLDAMTALVLTGLVMGGVELVKRLSAKDWTAAGVILAAAVIGCLGGMWMGVDPLKGMAYGLAASGYVSLVQNVGKTGAKTEEQK